MSNSAQSLSPQQKCEIMAHNLKQLENAIVEVSRQAAMIEILSIDNGVDSLFIEPILNIQSYQQATLKEVGKYGEILIALKDFINTTNQ